MIEYRLYKGAIWYPYMDMKKRKKYPDLAMDTDYEIF